MTAPLAPGDWVECVRGYTGRRTSVYAGNLYRVVQLLPIASLNFQRLRPCCDNNEVCLSVHTDPADLLRTGGWCPCRFRPIYRPKAELIEGLLKVNVLDKAQTQSEEFFAGVCLTEPLPNGRWSPTGRWIAQ